MCAYVGKRRDAVILDGSFAGDSQSLVGLTVRGTVICRGNNLWYICGGLPSDGVRRTLIWGFE